MIELPEALKTQAPFTDSSSKRSLSGFKQATIRWLKKDRSVAKKIILLTLPALGLTLAIYGLTAIFEPYNGQDCKERNISWDYFSCKIANSKLLGQVQNFSILLALSLFILDTRDRRKQSERLAWQLIDGARGTETSGARIQALEELNEAGASLRGLDADGADLIKINLKKADLAQSSLKGTLLQRANLYKANLYKAKLQKANLRGANLQGADLWGANLEEANLQECEPDLDGRDVSFTEQVTNLKNAKLGRANLRKAILQNADLRGADLRGSFLQGADLRGACLQGANLSSAHFADARITIEQLQSAKEDSWKEAKYDADFCQTYHELNLLLDDPIEVISSKTPSEYSPELKLLGVVHTLLITKEVDRRQEITEIRQKIMELIHLLDSGSSSPLHDHPLVGELTTAVERLTLGDQTSGDVNDRLTVTRNALEDVKDKLREQREAYERADKLEQQAKELERQAEEDKELYREAGKWLRVNQEIVKNQVIKFYLIQYPDILLSSNITIGTSENLQQQLEADIVACLDQLVYCLCKPEKPHYSSIKFNLSISTQAAIFRIILDVISELLEHSSCSLSQAILNRLSIFIKLSIDKFQELPKDLTL